MSYKEERMARKHAEALWLMDEMRKRHLLTSNVAEMMGCSVNTVSKFLNEGETRRMTLDEFCSFCRSIGVSMDDAKAKIDSLYEQNKS